MAADGWFYAPWYVAGWFPPVWFAPADESHLVPQEIAPGGARRRRVTALPGWYVPQNTPIPVSRLPDEDEATLICLGGL